MKTVNKMIASIMFSTITVLAAPLQSVQANDDFQVIRAGSIRVGDNGGTNPRLFTFTLPANIITSSFTRNRAVLEYQLYNSQWDYNEIFVNPANPVCHSNNSDTTNQPASIGLIEDYDAVAAMENDWFTEHRTFRSNLLNAGSNTIMVCARNVNGDLSGNLDDFWIRHVVLHYKTSSFGLVLGQ